MENEFRSSDGAIGITHDENRRILLNRIRTPDGTILISHHRHDYVTYTDKNDLEYMVDGGNDYLRRNVHDEAPYEELSLYEDSPFEEIRLNVCRGTRGKNLDQPLKWVPIAEMSEEYLLASIQWNEDRGNGEGLNNRLYKKELMYRQEHNITITDNQTTNEESK